MTFHWVFKDNGDFAERAVLGSRRRGFQTAVTARASAWRREGARVLRVVNKKMLTRASRIFLTSGEGAPHFLEL